MNSIFIAHTPYHLLISCGLAVSYDNSTKKYLVIISDFENFNAYYQTILKWAKNPFTEIILLPGRYQSSGKIIDTVRFLKNNEMKLRKIFDKKLKKEKCKAFIFNDNRVEGQIVSFLNFKQKGVNIYVEDGSAAYSSSKLKGINFHQKLASKIVFGNWFEHLKVLGTSKYIDEVLVFYPKIVRLELKDKKIKMLPSTLFDELKEEFASLLLKNFDLNLESIRYDCIIIAPHSEYLEIMHNFNFEYVYKEIGNLFQKYFNTIGVKYHPIEKKDDYLNFFENNKFVLIPHSLPLEIIWLSLLKHPPKFVIGDASTALLTCNGILKNATSIISIVKILDLPHDQIFDTFNAVGIKTPKTLTELSSLL